MRAMLNGEQAQLVSLSCPHCGGREIESGDDTVFFLCRQCEAIVEPKGGELALLPCLWEKIEGGAPEGALYIPFWVFRTEVRLDEKPAVMPSLSYPGDFMVPASLAPERSVSIIRLGDKATVDAAAHRYSVAKSDIQVQLARYSRNDAAEAVELIFLSIERELFSRAPGTQYEVKPRYKNLCFLVWEKSKLDLFCVPDEPLFQPVEEQEKIDRIITLLSEGLTRKRFGYPFP